jgi:hypothetical protein
MEGPDSAQSSNLAQTLRDEDVLQQAVKSETGDNDEFLGDGDDDDTTYTSRPQLPKPKVHMRSLADLISEHSQL